MKMRRHMKTKCTLSGFFFMYGNKEYDCSRADWLEVAYLRKFNSYFYLFIFFISNFCRKLQSLFSNGHYCWILFYITAFKNQSTDIKITQINWNALRVQPFFFIWLANLAWIPTQLPSLKMNQVLRQILTKNITKYVHFNYVKFSDRLKSIIKILTVM